jgi:hypothetical protein
MPTARAGRPLTTYRPEMTAVLDHSGGYAVLVKYFMRPVESDPGEIPDMDGHKI